MKLPLLTAATLLTTLALACTSDAPATPSPSPTPTSEATATPAPTLHPTPVPPTRTPTASPTPVDRTRSLETVDLVIAAVGARDVDLLESLIRYTQVVCEHGATLDVLPYPACDDSGARTVLAFPAGACGYVWHTEPRPMLERFVERAGPLFAAIEAPPFRVDLGIIGASPGVPGDYRVIFSSQPGDDVVGSVAVVKDGSVTALWFGCCRPVDVLYRTSILRRLSSSEVLRLLHLLRPPKSSCPPTPIWLHVATGLVFPPSIA